MADFSSQCIYTNLKTTSALFTYKLFDFDNYVTQLEFFRKIISGWPTKSNSFASRKKTIRKSSKHITKNIKQVNLYDTSKCFVRKPGSIVSSAEVPGIYRNPRFQRWGFSCMPTNTKNDAKKKLEEGNPNQNCSFVVNVKEITLLYFFSIKISLNWNCLLHGKNVMFSRFLPYPLFIFRFRYYRYMCNKKNITYYRYNCFNLSYLFCINFLYKYQ